MSQYVYIRTHNKQWALDLWTVGFYDPTGTWHADGDHVIREDAAARIHYLNGGSQHKVELK